MVSSNLVLPRGARPVTADELKEFRGASARGAVVSRSKSILARAGDGSDRNTSGFWVRDPATPGSLSPEKGPGSSALSTLGTKVSLPRRDPRGRHPQIRGQVVSLGFAAGSRVFVCDNLAFRSELLVRRKHTVNGERNFVRAIAGAVTSLTSFKEAEGDRIRRLLHLELTDDQADALILRSFERGVIGARELPKVLHEWRNPAFEEFQPRTAWSLLNAFTSALRERAVSQPASFAVQTIQLNGLLDPKRTDAEPLVGVAV